MTQADTFKSQWEIPNRLSASVYCGGISLSVYFSLSVAFLSFAFCSPPFDSLPLFYAVFLSIGLFLSLSLLHFLSPHLFPSEGAGAVSGDRPHLSLCQAMCGGPYHVHSGDARHYDQAAACTHCQAHTHLCHCCHGIAYAGVFIQ